MFIVGDKEGLCHTASPYGILYSGKCLLNIMELHIVHHFEVFPTLLLCRSIGVHINSLKSGKNFTSASRKINVFLNAPLLRNERK